MPGSSIVEFVHIRRRRPLVWEARTIKLNSNPLFQIRRFSSDGTCLDDSDLAKLAGYPVRKMHVRLGKETFLRKMILAVTPAQRFVFVDKITGTIYDSITGRCKTSPVLHIEPGELA